MKQTKNDRGIQIRRKIKTLFYGFVNMWRHYVRFVRNGNYDYYASQERFLAMFISNYHVIEKGLAMPNFELGHTRDRVLLVCGDIVKYRELGFDTKNVQYQSALQAVDSYRRIHDDAGYKLDTELREAIDKALAGVDFEPHNQPETTCSEFFQSDIDFEKFARSRHSVRDYSEREIPIEELLHCADGARTTPTGCNRQPNKVYIVKNKDLIRKIANLQGGGRGFADRANAMLVITTRVEVFSYQEICESFKSGGMYAMNLLYALHDRHIGACPLVWNERKENDKKLRQWLGIGDNEEVVLLISAGYPNERFKYVQSNRNALEESVKVVE